MTAESETPQPPSLADVLASYGEVETATMSRIQALTAKAMTRNWTTIPHVTHHDHMDVTALEAHRRRTNSSRAGDNQLSPVPFLLKAVAAVLLELPQFNAALDAATNTIVRRKYVNLGLAIDTAGGLVVGVIRGCDTRELDELALLARSLTEKARGRGLTLSEMSGGCFTISSLGAAGGSGFTPIINAPEVAILGVSRLSDAPQRSADGSLVWRSLLPVSLSYDHRVINGADAGRFMAALQSQLDRLAEG